MTETGNSSNESQRNRLADCPQSPNCVCTQASRADQGMQPLRFLGTVREAMAEVVDVLKTQPRTKVLESRANYVHVVFTSLILRFKDDVEFLADQEAGLLHYRSASRLGYSDLGVNRRRMQRLRQLLVQTGKFSD